MEPFNRTFFALQLNPPEISIESPMNRTYNGSSIPLVFSIKVLSADKTVNWMGYSVDGQPKATVTGNTTLAELSSGLHNVTIYVNDTFGIMGASETVNFTVSIPQPFPTATVAVGAGGSAVIVVGAGLLVYFKKHKHQKTVDLNSDQNIANLAVYFITQKKSDWFAKDQA